MMNQYFSKIPIPLTSNCLVNRLIFLPDGLSMYINNSIFNIKHLEYYLSNDQHNCMILLLEHYKITFLDINKIEPSQIIGKDKTDLTNVTIWGGSAVIFINTEQFNIKLK